MCGLDRLEQQGGSKRPRRATSVAALINLGPNVANITEALRNVHASHDEQPIKVLDIDEEDSVDSASAAGPARTIRRLEETVNSLKRAAIQDKQVIDQLKTLLERTLQEARPSERNNDELIAKEKHLMDLAIALAIRHVDNLHDHELLSRTEAKLRARHAAATPECGICLNHNATVLLHPPHDGAQRSAQHWFCFECISSYAASKHTTASGASIECPLCRVRVASLPAVDLSLVAASNFGTWKVSEEDIHTKPIGAIAGKERLVEEATAAFLNRMHIPFTNGVLRERVTGFSLSRNVVQDALGAFVTKFNQVGQQQQPAAAAAAAAARDNHSESEFEDGV